MDNPLQQAARTENVPPLASGGLAKKFIFPVFFGAALFAAASYYIGLERLGAVLLEAKPWPLAGLVFLHVASLVFHALRIRVLFRGEASSIYLFHANNVCNMINSILPLRAGEFAMAILLSRKLKCGGGEALSTLFVDRLLGLISILVIFLVALPGFTPKSAAGTSIAQTSMLYVLFFVCIVAGIFVAITLERPLLIFAEAILAKLPLHTDRTLARLRSAIAGLHVLFHLRTSLPAFLLSLCCWACVIGLTYCAMLSVIESPAVTPAIFATFISIIGILLVSTPSGFGTVHGAFVLAFAMFGIGAEQSLAVGILVHTSCTVINILLGFWSGRQLDFRLNRITGSHKM